jgi:exodeoxyribonuclease VII small subunit
MAANRKKPSAPGEHPAPAEEDAPSFEHALERLETIVEELEGGSLSLEESLARYEEGVRLSRRLTQTLDQAEKRIERLVEEEGQAPTTRPSEDDPGKIGRATEGGEGELPF